MVKIYVPDAVGAGLKTAFQHDLVDCLLTPNVNNADLPRLLDSYGALFQNRTLVPEWSQLKELIENMATQKLAEALKQYLDMLMNYLSNLEKRTASPLIPPTKRFAPSLSDWRQVANDTNSSVNLNLLKSLEHTLLGQDTSYLRFLPEQKAIDVPDDLSVNDAQVMAEILEAGLIYKHLHTTVGSLKGKEKSPIKTALVRNTELHLRDYSRKIQEFFQTSPRTLLAIAFGLRSLLFDLRVMSLLHNKASKLDGFKFLVYSHTLSQSGDPAIARISSIVYNALVHPYYEYLEHWLLQSELTDDSQEFFVFYDTEKNHINDIVHFETTRLPLFLDLDEALCEKILQIGKSLIFLNKYCNETKWVNNFASRYYKFVFEVHAGLKSMPLNVFQTMIHSQYSEVLNHLTYVVHSKFLLFLHLTNLKRIMLMESGDLIDSIQERGAQMFSEPAVSLTSGKLSELLTDCLRYSSVKNLPSDFWDRIDARILDLIHGTIGWDVFTLEYKITEPALEAVLNTATQLTHYLRLFNFLWGLKHFQSALQVNYLEYNNFCKTDLKTLNAKLRNMPSLSIDYPWLLKSVRGIHVVRHKLASAIRIITEYVSFDLIEDAFKRTFPAMMFLKSPGPIKGSMKNQSLSMINRQFASLCELNSNLAALERVPRIEHNANEYTLDELAELHTGFVLRISNCKLLHENVIGKASGMSLVDQIFEILEIAFEFVKSSDEFSASVTKLVTVLNIGHDVDDYDADVQEFRLHVRNIRKYIEHDLYHSRLKPRLHLFQRDLRADADLKSLGRLLS